MALWCRRGARTGYTHEWCTGLRFSYTGELCAQIRKVILRRGEQKVAEILRKIWVDDHGQDIAEYAVMLAVILVISIGTIKLIGANANNIFSGVASQLAK
jgi:Flp pilus assembly pilin Flp